MSRVVRQMKEARYLIAMVLTLYMGCHRATRDDPLQKDNSAPIESADLQSQLDAIGVAYENHELNKVIDLCQEVLIDHPDSISAHFYIGAAYTIFLYYDEAIEHLREVLRVDPGNTNAMRWLEINKEARAIFDSPQEEEEAEPENGGDA